MVIQVLLYCQTTNKFRLGMAQEHEHILYAPEVSDSM